MKEIVAQMNRGDDKLSDDIKYDRFDGDGPQQ
jgi:hypothetical protein